MNGSMITASVSMGQIQKKIDTIGNNLANLDTNGYKSREVQFSSLLVGQMDNLPGEDNQIGRLTPDGIRLGYGAGVGETNLNLAPGHITQTDRELDVAISEPSQFFQIESVDDNGRSNRVYTRDGAFYLQPDDTNPNVLNLVTKDGNFVLGEAGRIQVPARFDKIAINEHGEINVTLNDGTSAAGGRLSTVNILRPQLMKSLSDNQFSLPDLAEQNLNQTDILQTVGANATTVQQGFLEKSNVDLTQEMTQLIGAQRSYQFNARAISIADETLGLINSIR